MIDVPKELDEANERMPVDLSQSKTPLDITVRSIALMVAQRHCGDATVKEGNLYQQLKMDNKLGGPLTAEDVVTAALIFERYLWEEWSKNIVGHALEDVLEEANQVLKKHGVDEPPIRPHPGGE